MMALSKKMLEQEPSEIEVLLPWHAAGTLNARDARRVEEALARDPELARQYAVIREEYAETIGLNESLGAPSARAMQKLFAAIDAEPAQASKSLSKSSVSLSSRITGFFATLSPRTLAWSASFGAVALLAQAGVIGVVLNQSSFNLASAPDEPVTRSFSGQQAPPEALVRFNGDARMSDINALLQSYQARIVGVKGGLFRLELGEKAMSKEQAASLLGKLQHEKIVNLAVGTP
jgi:hypothetical protein